MRNANTEKLDMLIGKIMKNISQKGDNYKHLVVQEWKDMLGVTVANNTSKIYVSKNILFVHMTSPVIKQEVSYVKDKILLHMNKKFPTARLKEIIIR